jgi:hydroxylaminobenzene mutase
LTGFAIPLLAVPRLGLSSHLEGVLNGLFLIALGLMWSRLVLPAWAGTATFVLALYGTYANWFATLLAAMWGAAGMMPLAGGGASASALAEALVAALLASLSLAMIATCLLVLWGLRRSDVS